MEKKNAVGLALAALLLVLAWVCERFGWPAAIAWGLYLAAYLVAGGPVLWEAVTSLFRREWPEEEFLMSAASLGALAICEPAEAVLVMLLFRVGEALEDRANDRSREKLKRLIDRRPETVTLLRENNETTVPAREAIVGDLMLLKPGELSALDGVVEEGSASLDTAALTGESVPRTVAPGQELLSGCVVLDAVLKVRVTRGYGDGAVARILKTIENTEKGKTERTVSRLARVYTPAVVLLALLTAVLPPLWTGQWQEWIRRGLTVLVVSCPCALVLSVPLTFFCAIGGAARRGILVRGSDGLETLARVKTVAFDKTGTLTDGQFRVREVTGREDAGSIAAAAEKYSTHPIARAIASAFDAGAYTVTDAGETPGFGVHAVVNGKKVTVGKGESAGVTVTEDGRVIGTLTVGDRVRDSAADTVKALKMKGIVPVMLTGDGEEQAARVAREVGIERVFSGLLPHQKAEKLETLEGPAAFVGDGLNDAPVLWKADVGLAMGGLGSDAAKESAGIVLMNDRLTGVTEARNIAEKAVHVAKENIVLSLLVKAAVVILGLLGAAPMALAVFADVGVMLLAVLNALRAGK